MRHRDWAGGEDSPRERRPSGSWDEPAGPRRLGAYPSDSHRTPSRRRASERGQDEPVDAYLPRWAVESGVSRADGGGRHAAPDDEVETPPSGGGWRTDSGWRTDGGWRRDEPRGPGQVGAGPLSDHTAEWTVDTPQERGYVGSRRADDEPVSGVTPRSRPRRAASRRPEVTWSGLPEPTGPGDDRGATAERPAGQRRTLPGSSWPPAMSTSESAWSRPVESESAWSLSTANSRQTDPWERPADPWERSRAVERDPAEQPAVDPWDASGVHAWGRSAPGDRWNDTGSRWDRTEHTGEWARFTDTGPLEPVRDSGAPRVDPWGRTGPPTREGWASPERAEQFWSGTRLADDDPRWGETSSSAPRSPAVTYSAPRPRTAPRRGPVQPAVTGRAAGRRGAGATGGPWGRRLEDDLLDPDPGGPLRPVVYTAACYVVPAALLFLALLFLNGQPPTGCVTDVTGGGCDSQRAHALASLLSGAPRFGLAMASSLVVAVLLRQVGTSWRSATVALAAAVVGGGLSTVVISAVTGKPIG
ncbi:hypothetical protein [Micromonospora sp. DT31]|uniref:hypothetical protein n=1 Tax=Micromonospora sp. DT31 TaxID=3393434 RepID=UPI003CEA0E37